MDGRERSAAAVRERIGPALTIVRDEAPDGHGLHRMIGDVDRAVVNAGRDAEQNHAVLCAELCRRLFHHLFPPPAKAREVTVGSATHGRVVVIAAAASRGLGNSPRQ
jgi:hypothetical protein